jgi:hypothetical protein
VVLRLEDWWVLTTPHTPKSVCYNFIYCFDICRTMPRNNEWVRIQNLEFETPEICAGKVYRFIETNYYASAKYL